MKKTIVLTAAALTAALTLSATPAAAAVAQSSKPTPTVQLSAVDGSKYSAGGTIQPMNWVCRIIPCGRS
ncbi:hypothetical protein E8P82_14665 [Arthrobacter echini]|uniref:Uncharacterized protein n=1 Tax=Arthrobacter echini TaxID=1529066 RepID=A0A4S5E002_9MICC|nr:hypothetical protein [Arthrobacter echini]THJ64611.1 hypothetical protein E8P82_14665 [Arthrobacter echini]